MSSFNRDRRRRRPNRQERGRRFEDVAARFYERNGFEILEKNWRAGHKEIDLIARKGDKIVFVEVKSAATNEFGHPAHKVDATKMRNLTDAAKQYVVQKKVEDCDLRFDVVTFFEGKMEHYPNAFPAE
ncbi:MAG: YraN family protein [Candidatus Zixiibacteriota bacterium]|jgi:putative endonuclease